MPKPTISVNICVYKPGPLLAQALDCMLQQKTDDAFSFEVLVIDDEPSDDTVRYVANVSASSSIPVRYVQAGGKGVSHARNVGIANSDSEWIAWFDQDQTTEPTWLMELFSTAMATGAEWVDGPRDVPLTENDGPRMNAYLRACLGEIWEGNSVHQHTRRYASCTGNALVKKSVLNAAGSFDETIVDGWEDWDYVRRVREKGYQCWYAPKALVHHIVPSERLERSFIKWHSLRVGAAFASRDVREWGLPKTLLACAARIGQSALIHMPLLLTAALFRNETAMLTYSSFLLRTTAYTRKTFYYLSPTLFAQDQFHSRLRLRNEPKYAEKGNNL